MHKLLIITVYITCYIFRKHTGINVWELNVQMRIELTQFFVILHSVCNLCIHV